MYLFSKIGFREPMGDALRRPYKSLRLKTSPYLGDVGFSQDLLLPYFSPIKRSFVLLGPYNPVLQNTTHSRVGPIHHPMAYGSTMITFCQKPPPLFPSPIWILFISL